MDKSGDTSSRRNNTRTDLSLLLECLKFQMKCPDLQKQALLAIHSICENREDNVDILRQMGGVAFIYNLSKSSCVHSDVKETALFTLGTLAEANVYCKSSLCRKETFADLAGLLMKEEIPLTQKKVSVYLLSVFVANNKSGQTLAQTTGCLDILLDLFRTTFPLATEASLGAANATQIYQLWASVCSALCGCVNNPQNDEGQRICVVTFPMIKIWLQQIALSKTEVFQCVCSFIAMTVANNSGVQECFAASGGLDSLTLALVHLTSAANTNLLSCQLSVITSKTLSACITENPPLSSGLAKYGVVSHLLFLLASPHLDTEERLSVLLTLGHCTVASEEHQFQLVQCGGLPLIITLLIEDTSEEVRKAATFILQTCKQATASLEVPGLIVTQDEGKNVNPVTNMEGFRNSAKELLQRIDLLEKRQAKEAEDEGDTNGPSFTKGLVPPFAPPALPLSLQPRENINTVLTASKKTSTPQHVYAKNDYSIEHRTARGMVENESEWRRICSSVSVKEEMALPSGDEGRCTVCEGTGALTTSEMQPLEGDRVKQTSATFRLPVPLKNSVQGETMKEKNDEEESQNCELNNTRKGTIPVKEHSLPQMRCAGCVLPFEEVTSHTFSSLQSSCQHSCDMHKILQEASEHFRTAQCHLLFNRECKDSTVGQAKSLAEPQKSRGNWSAICLTPRHKAAGTGKSFLPGNKWRKHNDITLTPLRKGATKAVISSLHPSGPGLTPLKKSHHPEERREENDSRLPDPDDEMKTHIDHVSTRRKRKDFSREEVRYLLCGVKTFGFSWDSILCSYPFQPGRTNVDLADKYRRLKKAGAANVGSWP